jgi:hypothetical protein
VIGKVPVDAVNPEPGVVSYGICVNEYPLVLALPALTISTHNVLVPKLDAVGVVVVVGVTAGVPV